jgi:hypothetical protein
LAVNVTKHFYRPMAGLFSQYYLRVKSEAYPNSWYCMGVAGRLLPHLQILVYLEKAY